MQRASPGKNNSSPFSHLVPTAVEFPLFFYFEIDNVIQNVLQFHITISFPWVSFLYWELFSLYIDPFCYRSLNWRMKSFSSLFFFFTDMFKKSYFYKLLNVIKLQLIGKLIIISKILMYNYHIKNSNSL